LNFILTHKHLLGSDELRVMYVQMPLPTGFNVVFGFDRTVGHHAIEPEKVLKPVKQILDQRVIKYRCMGADGRWSTKPLTQQKMSM